MTHRLTTPSLSTKQQDLIGHLSILVFFNELFKLLLIQSEWVVHQATILLQLHWHNMLHMGGDGKNIQLVIHQNAVRIRCQGQNQALIEMP